MANIIGQIKGYHGGAQTLANIYDAKQTSIGTTKVLMHFDSSPTRDECGNTWNDYGSQKCLALNGSSYLQTTNITLGGKDFTIDFWGYMSSATGNWSRFFSIFDNLNSEGNRIWIGRNGTSNNLSIDVLDSAGWTLTDAWKDKFNHYAIVYQHSASTITFYVNGQLISSQSLSIAARTLKNCWIGRSEHTADANLTGFIDDFRISNGIARWTANFTPPARGSIYKDANTTALLKFNTDTTTDECGNTWTAYGSPYLSSSVVTVAQTKFDKALVLDGTNYLQMSNNITLGGQDFTIDFWGYMSSSSGDWCYLWATSDDKNGANRYNYLNEWKIFFNGVNVVTGITFNTWHHIAMVYQHGAAVGKVYVDGILKGSVNGTFAPTTFFLTIGSGAAGVLLGNYKGIGYIDEFRIVDGAALWTSNFTPPTSAYTKTSGLNAVNANMLIRHGNTNGYIPLTTDAAKTTKPYLAVRHGSINYYAIK